MKRNICLFICLACLFTGTVSAATIEFEYQYDGSTFTSVLGNDLIGTELAVGDVLNLTYTAMGDNSYWDFSSVGSEGNVNLGFEYSSSAGSRSSHGEYSAFLDGVTLLEDTYTVSSQGSIHLGPNHIDFTTVSALDQFSISYALDSSTASNNIIGSYSDTTWWQVWELFGNSGVPFVYVQDNNGPDPVPEPATFILLGSGLAGLAFYRRKRK